MASLGGLSLLPGYDTEISTRPSFLFHSFIAQKVTFQAIVIQQTTLLSRARVSGEFMIC
jgi:hypothetical protein